MTKRSGIYKIVCLTNGKIYVGSSKDIDFRWRRHRMFLRNNNHVNSHLQAAWNKYGKSSFTLEVIELCDVSDLIKKEDFWIDETKCLDKSIGFNKRDGASGGTTISGEDHYLYGKSLSEDVKAKISASRVGKCTGEEHHGSKLDWKKVRRIRQAHKNGAKIKYLAKEYGVSKSAIERVVNFTTWKV